MISGSHCRQSSPLRADLSAASAARPRSRSPRTLTSGSFQPSSAPLAALRSSFSRLIVWLRTASCHSRWSSRRIKPVPPLTCPFDRPGFASGMVNLVPRRWYWKFFFRCIRCSPVLAETVTVVRMREGLPQLGQKRLVESLQILRVRRARRAENRQLT